jgi:hypothetical protein
VVLGSIQCVAGAIGASYSSANDIENLSFFRAFAFQKRHVSAYVSADGTRFQSLYYFGDFNKGYNVSLKLTLAYDSGSDRYRLSRVGFTGHPATLKGQAIALLFGADHTEAFRRRLLADGFTETGAGWINVLIWDPELNITWDELPPLETKAGTRTETKGDSKAGAKGN